MKSAQQMVLTAQDFKAAGIDMPILVGGAALHERFTDTKISQQYDGPVSICERCDARFGTCQSFNGSNEREVLVHRTS